MSPRSRLRIFAAGFGVSLTVAALYVHPPAVLARLDLAFYDLRLRRAFGGETSDRPVVVDIDERSLAEHGRWPWPRHRLARLLEKIRARGAAVVALDMMFPEPDEPASDAALVDVLRGGPFVVGYAFTFAGDEAGRAGCILRPVSVVAIGAAAGPSGGGAGAETGGAGIFRASGAICSTDAIAGAAAGAGFLNAAPDADGIFRRIPQLVEYGGRVYPSLALATLMRVFETRQVELNGARSGARALRVGDVTVPLDARGSLLLRFRGARKRFPYVSAADLLADRLPPGALRDRIVFVGTSALGVPDVVATPLDPLFPGVEVHATVVDNAIRGDFLRRPGWATGLELTLVCALGVGSAWVLGSTRSAGGAFVVAAAGALTWLASAWAMRSMGVVVSPLFPSLALIGSFAVVTVLNVAIERRRAERGARSLQTAKRLMLHALTSLTEIRDSETGTHLLRTQRYTHVLGERLASHARFRDFLTKETIELLVSLAPIHDIGKVGVQDRTLRKPGPLDAEELREMRRHPEYGRDVIEKAQRRAGIRDEALLRLAKEIVYSHHEWWDGTGYPEGLKGDAIPIAARMVALVDVYDALISTRVYKASLPHATVVASIVAERGTHFDPDVVDAFLTVQDEWRRIAVELADDPEDAEGHARELIGE